MALLFFGIAICLFVTLDSHSATSTVDATASQGVEVSYGSVIKLMHEKTKFRLHSHSVPYGSGSGQQSLTCFPRVDDANSYWIVRPVPETSAKQGDSIKTGTIIRLQHMKTRKWLHSHLYASPISGNLEVSCNGDDGNSDTGDHWRLEIEGSGKTWKHDKKIRLRHVETSGYLHSHDKKYSGVAGGQQEVSYGSVIKLMHEKTKFRLHSHSVPYGSGSGQQSVTCFPRVDDANSYWPMSIV